MSQQPDPKKDEKPQLKPETRVEPKIVPKVSTPMPEAPKPEEAYKSITSKPDDKDQ
jgi:hypothetical protein